MAGQRIDVWAAEGAEVRARQRRWSIVLVGLAVALTVTGVVLALRILGVLA